jgi:hypothetical protein
VSLVNFAARFFRGFEIKSEFSTEPQTDNCDQMSIVLRKHVIASERMM